MKLCDMNLNDCVVKVDFFKNYSLIYIQLSQSVTPLSLSMTKVAFHWLINLILTNNIFQVNLHEILSSLQ